MVVKAATKKKLMDLGCPESNAHRWADDRRWHEDIVPMNFDDIMGLFPYSWSLLNWLGAGNMKRPKGSPPRKGGEIGYVKYVYDMVETIRENELVMVAQIEKKYRDDEGGGDVYETRARMSRAEYRKVMENFGMIPLGSPYSYLREDSQNFMNWINENPLEVKQ